MKSNILKPPFIVNWLISTYKQRIQSIDCNKDKERRF
jgi:hypothetical protein